MDFSIADIADYIVLPCEYTYNQPLSISFQAYVELDDQEQLQENVLNDAIEAKEDAKKKANEKIQKYYEKQKVVYEGDACAVVYNVGGIVHVSINLLT